MDSEINREPSEVLKTTIEAGDKTGLDAQLTGLSPSETARAISHLSEMDRTRLLTMLEPQQAAEVIEDVPEAQAVHLIEYLPPPRAAAIVEELDSDNKADLLGELKSIDAEAILKEMPPSDADEVRRLMSHPPESAGGIMITEFLSYPENMMVADLLRDLQENAELYSDYDVQYVYITNHGRKLAGVLRLRDLLFASRSDLLRHLMIPRPHHVAVDSSLQDLKLFFEDHNLVGVPVLDKKGWLAGVVKRSAVKEALARQTSRTFLRFSGIVGGEELRSMATFPRASRRLSWLSINIVLNIIAASVIAFYQDTLREIIALAVFLPILSDMSGCSGNQAVAVSMRELTMGLIKPRDFLRVFFKECPVGILNGFVLGMLLGLAAGLWKQNVYLGLVVGIAMAANTVIAVCAGSLIPLALRRLRLDPALVSSPVLTTITDMCGFFLVLSLADLMLAYLRI